MESLKQFMIFKKIGIPIVLLFLVAPNVFGQLGKTKSEIFYNEGTEYTNKDIQTDFTVYSYLGNIPKLDEQLCFELVSYYINNADDICFQETYVSCAAAANTYVKFFNDIAVEVEPNKWKDYGNNSIYTLVVKDEFAYVEHYYEYE